jgi:hypothetical protein
VSAQLTAKIRQPGRELRDSLTAQPWVSRKTGKPFCLLRWGKREGRLTPAEMRQLGVAFIQVAAAAESDAALMAALRDEVRLDERMSVQMLSTVQGYREWAAVASGEVAAHSGCPYPGAHLQPGEHEQEDEPDVPVPARVRRAGPGPARDARDAPDGAGRTGAAWETGGREAGSVAA